MAHEKIVTAFKQLSQAQVAKEKLIAEGISESHIDIISGERLRVEDKEIRHPSFWQRLFGNEVDDDYATEYDRAVREGGVLLTARVPKDDADRIETLLDQYAADYSTLGNTHTTAYNSEVLGETPNVTGPAPTPAAETHFTGTSTGAGLNDTILPEDAGRESLKLAEEQINIGKRQVSDGIVRLRRYTVEEDVSEDISLYEQHAERFRTAVDEPAYLGDVDWSEKTIGVEESHEVPTINKTAHIREEVGLRTAGTERVETVKDTVRRQEADVEQTEIDPATGKTIPGLRK